MTRVVSIEDVFVGEMNEYVTTEYLMQAGVPFSRIKKAVEKGELVKVDRGIYASPDTLEDDYSLIQMRYAKGIYSGFSALYLQQMCDYLPEKYHMTFPHGYNCRSIESDPRGIVVTRTLPEFYNLGVTKVETPCGNIVRAYDRERTLCDILRGRGIDRDIVKQAMREYIHSGDMNIRKLVEYAEVLHVRSRIDQYMQVML